MLPMVRAPMGIKCGGVRSASALDLAGLYMYRPGPRTINEYDPISMTRNMIKARANSMYSVPKVAPRTTPTRRMAAKMAKDIAPVMITVLSIDMQL
jgi:hypothetical protein